MPYDKEFVPPSKIKYNGAGYNLRFEEGHAELVGDESQYWYTTNTGKGIQNSNNQEVYERRVREAVVHPSDITIYEKRTHEDDDFHPQERRKYQLVDDHWPKPKEKVKVIAD